MPSSVLVILVAVVVLIAVVVFGGMRYLRSDDEEEFDDVAAERGTGGRGGHLPAVQGRARRDHDDFDAERDLPPAARSGAGRDPGTGRGPDPRREQRGGRGGYDDDRTELVPAGGRATRVQQTGSRIADGSDTAPGRSRSREFDRDSRDFNRDDAGRRDGRGRSAATKADDRVQRDRRHPRSAPPVRELAVADLDALDRRSAAKTVNKPAGRKNGQGSGDEEQALPAVKPRSGKGKGKRDSDGDWPSNKWDELSDVDYWTELAADKPFAADSPAASQAGQAERTSARDSGRKTGGGATRESGAGRRPSGPGELDATKRIEQPLLPPVGRPADRSHGNRSDRRGPRDRSAHWAAEDRGEDLTATDPRRWRSDPARELARSEPRPPRQAQTRPALADLAASASRPAPPPDDDPLTSPSFPRIEANDSRSYRRGRSGTHERPAAGYAAAPTSYDQPAADYAWPASDSYRAAAASRSGQVPDSYLLQAAPGSSPAGYSAAGDLAGQGNQSLGYGYSPSLPASYQTPVADPGNYESPGSYDRSLPVQQSAGQAGYQTGSPAYDGAGYNGAGYNGSSYGAPYNGASHNGASHNSAGQHAVGYETGHYGTTSAGYGGGHPVPGAGHDPMGYPGLAVQGESGGYASPSAGLSGYADPAASAEYQPSEPGYLPGSRTEAAYPYQPGVTGSYLTPAVPGAQAAANHYQPSPVYQGPPAEPGSYAGADPYAVDPYGYGNRSY